MPIKKPRGRPTATGEPRTARVMVRLTPDELAAFDAAARADDRKLADWLRLQGLKATG